MRGEVLKEKAKIFVINGDGDLLALKKSKSAAKRSGRWDILGGKREPEDRTIEITANREITEESELVIAGLVYLTSVLKGESQTHFFAGYIEEVNPWLVLSSEHCESRWVSPSPFFRLRSLPEHYKDVGREHLIDASSGFIIPRFQTLQDKGYDLSNTPVVGAAN